MKGWTGFGVVDCRIITTKADEGIYIWDGK